jgi:hypothetical protein
MPSLTPKSSRGAIDSEQLRHQRPDSRPTNALKRRYSTGGLPSIGLPQRSETPRGVRKAL